MIYGAGVDVGSTQTKVVILWEDRRIVGRSLIDTGANVSKAAERAFVKALEDAGLPREAVGYVVGTGYGRYKVTFGDAQVTEITCHARGAQYLYPATRTVFDMGGQDTKAIKVGPDGSVLDFSMNDKCAAGTGRFLMAAADVTGLSLGEIGERALLAKNPVRLTSVCTVFGESDIMSYLAQKKTIEDILGGVHKAIATRTMSLIRRGGVEEEVTVTGGVPKNNAMGPGGGEGGRARPRSEGGLAMLVAGIDIGSGTTKCVLIDEKGSVRGRGLAKTKAAFEKVARETFEAALQNAGVTAEEVGYVATTGLGRYSISFRDIQITDLTCGAPGAAVLFPSTKYVLDIGAQSTRAIRLREGGKVKEFHMNEKCAAGSGGFLERAAKYLEVTVEDIGPLSRGAQKPQPISSVCAVHVK